MDRGEERSGRSTDRVRTDKAKAKDKDSYEHNHARLRQHYYLTQVFHGYGANGNVHLVFAQPGSSFLPLLAGADPEVADRISWLVCQ